VDFICAGPAIWRGGYNSGKTNSINNTFLDLECGINRVAVRSLLQPGTITVTAKCDGLKSGSVTIQSKPFAVENGYARALPVIPAVLSAKELPARLEFDTSGQSKIAASKTNSSLTGTGRQPFPRR
jgi:beta-galactosidase